MSVYDNYTVFVNDKWLRSDNYNVTIFTVGFASYDFFGHVIRPVDEADDVIYYRVHMGPLQRYCGNDP